MDEYDDEPHHLEDAVSGGGSDDGGLHSPTVPQEHLAAITHPGDPALVALTGQPPPPQLEEDEEHHQPRQPTSSASLSPSSPYALQQDQQRLLNNHYNHGNHNQHRPLMPQHPPAPPPPPPPVVIPELTNPICRICGQGNEEGRPVLRFLPVPHEAPAARAAPGVVTFTEDVCLHIFCGKTASILPTVNRPDLEILTKAGLKNKHGIGPEVNSALARTRSAILLHAPLQEEGQDSSSKLAASAAAAAASNKEKQYFLVREFEAHLASIRRTHLRFSPTPQDAADQAAPALPNDPFSGHDLAGLGDAYNVDVAMEYVALTAPEIPIAAPSKSAPIKANAGQIHKHSRRKAGSSSSHQQQLLLDQQHDPQLQQIPHGAEVQPDGKVKCPCGGTHLPPNQQRGAQSWRNHIMTKRHQKWMEEQGLVGAV
ncbi:hypothetical protein ACA910_009928 [Epithemia clementina (nom. ined.)]